MDNIKLGKYLHYKGKFYEVIGIAKHSETLADFVVYETLYNNPKSKIWVRPIDDFVGEKEIGGKKVKRFRFISK